MSRNAPTAAPTLERLGDRAYESGAKISAEFFAISYGSLVRQILATCDENIDAVNHQLDELGSRIGMRLIEEYVAKSQAPPCRVFARTAESIAKVGLKMFLGINGTVTNVVGSAAPEGRPGSGAAAGGASGTAQQQAYSIEFTDNPLNYLVELPQHMQESIWYSNVLCGVIRGALEQVGIHTDVHFVRDTLRGHTTNEIRVALKGVTKDSQTFKTQKD